MSLKERTIKDLTAAMKARDGRAKVDAKSPQLVVSSTQGASREGA